MNPSEVFKRFRKSVFLFCIGNKTRGISGDDLETKQGPVKPIGTMFLIAKDKKKKQGLFLTASHVFEVFDKQKGDEVVYIWQKSQCLTQKGIQKVAINAFGGFKNTDLAKGETDKDIAIFSAGLHDELLEEQIEPIPLSCDVCVGDPMVVLGYPYCNVVKPPVGQKLFTARIRLTSGHCASIVNDPVRNCLDIEFDNFIGGGNSGGPLINCRTGKAVGVIKSTLYESTTSTTFSFATFVYELRDFFQDFPDLKIEDMPTLT